MLEVVFSDDSLMVLEKPAGLVVTSSETQSSQTLEDILKEEFSINLDRGGIVHRLDKDTSGLILVAKTAEAMEKLQAQFKSREVKKEYLALVHGWVEEAGRVEGAIMRNLCDREKFIVVASQASPGVAREAVTEYEPIEKFKIESEKLKAIFEGFNNIQMRKLERSRYGQFTLLRCYPLTGRTHQIRVHLKYAGFPIVGDEKYGGRKTVRLDHRWCKRQFLHAAKLSFTHPQSGERIELESALPEDLKQAIETLEKVNGKF